jgi:hypothetical protein
MIHILSLLQEHGLLSATIPVLSITSSVPAAASGAADTDAAGAVVEAVEAPVPVRAIGSASDIMYRRDRIWVRRQPREIT